MVSRISFHFWSSKLIFAFCNSRVIFFENLLLFGNIPNLNPSVIFHKLIELFGSCRRIILKPMELFHEADIASYLENFLLFLMTLLYAPLFLMEYPWSVEHFRFLWFNLTMAITLRSALRNFQLEQLKQIDDLIHFWITSFIQSVFLILTTVFMANFIFFVLS